MREGSEFPRREPKSPVPRIPPPEQLLESEDGSTLAAQGEVDKKEHYDLDGVSYENGVGVVVASDASKVSLESAEAKTADASKQLEK